MQLADLSWDQVNEYLAHDDRLIFPLGATEQHGRHLGLGCDFQIAEAIARAAGDQTGALVAPVLAYGMSLHHMRFTGTLSLTPSTLYGVLVDIMRTAHAHGFHRILTVNGHGGNTASLDSALAVVANELTGLRVKQFEWWKEADILKMVDDAVGVQRGTHSSPAETAFLMAARPEAIHMDRAPRRDAPVDRSREFLSAKFFAEKYPDGVMGLEPTPGSAELGARLMERSVQICVEELEKW